MKKFLLPALLYAGLGASGIAAQQDDSVVVMTSYPQELISRYETAFEAAYPTIDMRIEWRHSDDAWQLLRSSPAAGVDVYWSPSIDTFAAMADAAYFTPLPLPGAGLPGRIGDLLVDDPGSRYAAFEVAGFGFAFSKPYLDEHKLSVPRDWSELAAPRYAGSILMPVPSQQGFSPMIYESILQAMGWEEGWSLITAIAVNSELMTAEGMNFIDAIADGSKGLALTIDFFPKSAQANGLPVDFAYAATSLFSPAHVAILQKAPHPQAAQAFMDFVLSDAGQRLLLHRDVARLPVRPSAYVGSESYNPFTGAVRVPAYDFDLTGVRKTLIAALFDVQVTERHAPLVNAMAALREAEQMAGLDAADKVRIAAARTALQAPVLDAAAAEELLAALSADAETALPLAQWSRTLAERTEQALGIASSILAGRQ